MPTGGGATGNPGTTTSAGAGAGTSSGTVAVAWGGVGTGAWETSWCTEATLVTAIGAGVSQRAMESWTVVPLVGMTIVWSAVVALARQLIEGRAVLHGAVQGRAQGADDLGTPHHPHAA